MHGIEFHRKHQIGTFHLYTHDIPSAKNNKGYFISPKKIDTFLVNYVKTRDI